MFENRRWLIIPTSMTGSINFDTVHENSAETLRVSLDGLKTFVKYDVQIVEETQTITVPDPETGENSVTVIEAGVYGRPSFYSEELVECTHEEILDILAGPEWTSPIDPQNT